jgi:hypothetical protein
MSTIQLVVTKYYCFSYGMSPHIWYVCVQSIAHFYRNTEQGRVCSGTQSLKLYISILSFAQNVFHTVLQPHTEC